MTVHAICKNCGRTVRIAVEHKKFDEMTPDDIDEFVDEAVPAAHSCKLEGPRGTA